MNADTTWFYHATRGYQGNCQTCGYVVIRVVVAHNPWLFVQPWLCGCQGSGTQPVVIRTTRGHVGGCQTQPVVMWLVIGHMVIRQHTSAAHRWLSSGIFGSFGGPIKTTRVLVSVEITLRGCGTLSLRATREHRTSTLGQGKGRAIT